MTFEQELEAGMHPRIIYFHFSDRSTTARLKEIDDASGSATPVRVYKGHSVHVVKGSPEITRIEISITSGKFRVKPNGGPYRIHRGDKDDLLTFYPISLHSSAKSEDNVIVNHFDEHVCDPTGPCG